MVTHCKEIISSFHRCNSSLRLNEMLCDKLGWHRCLLCLKVNWQNFKKVELLPSRVVFATAVRMRREGRSAASKEIQRNLSEHQMHHQIIGKLKVETHGFIHKIKKFDKKLMDGLMCYSQHKTSAFALISCFTQTVKEK